MVGKLAKDNLVGIRDKMYKEAKERLCLRDEFLVTTASCRGVRTVLDLGEGEHVEEEPSWGQGDVRVLFQSGGPSRTLGTYNERPSK